MIIGMLIFLLLVLFYCSLIFWGTHLHMSKQYRNDCESYGYAGFKKFKKEFDKVDWFMPENSLDFLYDKKYPYHSYKIGASLFEFNKIQMVVHNPISYFFVCLYVKKYINRYKNLRKRKVSKIKW